MGGKDGELLLKELKRKTNFLKKIDEDKKLKSDFLTLDIETFRNSKNKLIPYCISFFDGLDTSSFYLTDQL